MAEYSDLRAKIKIPEVGTSDWFSYTKGAKQGGVETPDIWKLVLDYLFEPVISQWAEKQWGFKVKDEDGELITTLSHGIFADNVIIISDTLLTLQNMIDELTEALQKPRNNKGESYLRWKPKSLESMHNDRTNITQHNEARGEEPGDALLSDHGPSDVQLPYRPGSELTRWKPPTDMPIPSDPGSRCIPYQRKRNQEDPREGEGGREGKYRHQLRVVQDGKTLRYTTKEKTTILGEEITNKGSTEESIAFNLAKADSAYFKHKKIRCNTKLPVQKRLRAWHYSVISVATYGQLAHESGKT